MYHRVLILSLFPLSLCMNIPVLLALHAHLGFQALPLVLLVLFLLVVPADRRFLVVPAVMTVMKYIYTHTRGRVCVCECVCGGVCVLCVCCVRCACTCPPGVPSCPGGPAGPEGPGPPGGPPSPPSPLAPRGPLSPYTHHQEILSKEARAHNIYNIPLKSIHMYVSIFIHRLRSYGG